MFSSVHGIIVTCTLQHLNVLEIFFGGQLKYFFMKDIHTTLVKSNFTQ